MNIINIKYLMIVLIIIFLSVGSVVIFSFFFLQLAICAFYLSSLSISLKKVSILFSDSFKELDFALIGCFLYYFLLL